MTDLDRLLHALDTGALRLPDGPLLALNAPPGLSRLGRPGLSAEQGMKPLHDALAAEGIAVRPRLDEGAFAAALLVLPRNRVQGLGMLARALRLTLPGGLVALSGARTDGVDTVIARLREVLPAESLAKGHGKCAWVTRPDPLPDALAAWEAAAAPTRNAEGFLSAPGMFSHAHADPGSRLLAATLAGTLHGTVAELGAGFGWLAATLLAANPGIAWMTLVEADHAACEAARANVADPRAEVLWADATALRGTGFDHVVTNPPFHAGREADPGLGVAFLTAAARMLGPRGRLTLVANRQLPYEAALDKLFAERREVASGGGYKVLAAERPRGPRATVRRKA